MLQNIFCFSNLKAELQMEFICLSILLKVTHKGDFSNGISTIQCMYAPEFTSHSEGVGVVVQ